MVFGVMGLFRLGELLPKGRKDATHNLLLPVHITSTHSAVKVRLDQSKTDPFRIGMDVVMEAHESADGVCPLQAWTRVQRWRKKLGLAGTAIFTEPGGEVIHKAALVEFTNGALAKVDNVLGIKIAVHSTPTLFAE